MLRGQWFIFLIALKLFLGSFQTSRSEKLQYIFLRLSPFSVLRSLYALEWLCKLKFLMDSHEILFTGLFG